MTQWILADGHVSKGEFWIFRIMQHFGSLVAFAQAALLLAGTIVVLPNMSEWQHTNSEIESTFCQLGPVIFSLAFLLVSWFFIGLGIVIYVFVKFCDPTRE